MGVAPGERPRGGPLRGLLRGLLHGLFRDPRSDPLRDVRPSDLAVGFTAAFVVLAAAAAVMEVARLQRRADVPPIDPGLGVPIQIRPILDAPARGGRDGRSGPTVVPDHWTRARRRPAAARRDPSTADAPDGATPDPSTAPSATNPGVAPPSRVAKTPTAPGALPSLTDPDSDPDSDGPDDPSPSTEPASSDPSPSPGEGDGDGDGDGGGDGGGETAGAGSPDGVLQARAIEAYRDRLSRWLSARFTVTGSGLSRAALLRHRVRAIVRISAEGSVVGFEVIPSGNAAFDRGAREALQSVQGEPLPAPPDHYPDALQRELKITFVCRESQCD